MKDLVAKIGKPSLVSFFSDNPEKIQNVVADFGVPCSTWGIVCQGCWEDFVVFLYQNPTEPVEITCRNCQAHYFLDCENHVLLDSKKRSSMPSVCLVKVALNVGAEAAQDLESS